MLEKLDETTVETFSNELDTDIESLSKVSVDSISENISSVKGETLDSGNITVLCPDGWASFRIPDYLSSKEDAKNPNAIDLRKAYLGLDENKAFIWANSKGGYSQISIQLELESEGVRIGLGDAEVQAIINSIKIK